MSPEKQWYVFFEGDTYIVWDNVFRLLENFDADQPHYFGSPSPGRDGIWFANGGPGFILSRAAVRKLVRDDYTKDGSYLGSRVSVKQWNETLVNCCGDSILGWALWEESLKLDGLWPMFNPHPPHGVPFSDLYWCQPVLTMHKPHEEDMHDLWRWEWQHRNATVSHLSSLESNRTFIILTLCLISSDLYSTETWQSHITTAFSRPPFALIGTTPNGIPLTHPSREHTLHQ